MGVGPIGVAGFPGKGVTVTYKVSETKPDPHVLFPFTNILATPL